MVTNGGSCIRAMTSISIKRDVRSLKRGLNRLEREAFPQATVRTLNRLAGSTKTASARHIAPQIGSRQSGVKKRIQTRRANKRRLWATLVAEGKPLRLIEFVIGSKKATQQKGGKRGAVRAKAWGKRRTYHQAFIAPQRKGARQTTVYIRKSGKRLPVKQLYGPGIKQLFKQKENMNLMQRNVRDRLDKELKRNLAFYLSRIK